MPTQSEFLDVFMRLNPDYQEVPTQNPETCRAFYNPKTRDYTFFPVQIKPDHFKAKTITLSAQKGRRWELLEWMVLKSD